MNYSHAHRPRVTYIGCGDTAAGAVSRRERNAGRPSEVSVMHVGPLPLPLIIFLLAVILFLLVTSRASDDPPRKDPRACFDCGATHPPHANFCRRCGRRLP
jgi:hypothetical protein